ncbi:beta-phosphoglucomutase [Puteibacter caeruleilacunae]|nr:beta-phosphoglucomutase [Puteibacter caeruleilacunae]
MTEIKACIFDLDGVVVDTAKYHFIAWKQLADKLGFEFTEEHNELLKGVSRMRSLDILLEIGKVEISQEEKERLAAEKNDLYISLILKMTPEEILPGVEDFFKSLQQNNIKIALGSASKNAPLILERINLTHYFDAIVDGNSIDKAKPDPEVFLKGAEYLGVDPVQCVVFEDAIAGVEAAINGGMKCIGVGDANTLNHADFVISGFNEMSLERLAF